MVAEEVIIRGKTEGTIRANRVILADTCNVASEIYHRTFSVEEGARIEGALHFLDTPLQGLSTSEGDADDKTVGLSAVKNGASVSPADRMSGTATASN